MSFLGFEDVPDPWTERVLTTPEPLVDNGSENYLVRLLERELNQIGVPCILEQPCGDASIRADLVTENAVIEFKKDLERPRLYQARGQAETYANLLKKPQVIVVGRSPSSATEEIQSRRIAEDFKRSGCHVVFADPDGFWLEDIKIILALEGDREFKSPVSTPNTSALLERLQKLETEVKNTKASVEVSNTAISSIQGSVESISSDVDVAHNNIIEAITLSHKGVMDTVVQSAKQSKDLASYTLAAVNKRPSSGSGHMFSGKNLPHWALFGIAGIGAIAFGYLAGSSFFSQPVYLPTKTIDASIPLCRKELNDWNWEVEHSNAKSARLARQTLVNCLNQP